MLIVLGKIISDVSFSFPTVFKQRWAAQKKKARLSRERAQQQENTSDLPDENELSLSSELTEGTPEPVVPPWITEHFWLARPSTPGNELIEFSERALVLRSQTVQEPATQPMRTRVLRTPPVPAINGEKNSGAIALTIAPRRRAQSALTSSSHHLIPSRVPRTRILVTPERLTPAGLPPRRTLRTFKRKAPKTEKALRKKAKKIKRMKTRRRSLSFDSGASSSDGDSDASSDISTQSSRSQRKSYGDSDDGDDESATSDDEASVSDSDASSASEVPLLPYSFKYIKRRKMYKLFFYPIVPKSLS